ncbi:MAG: DUF5676 family membrane protein [Patescibacteria group bacterium]
MINIKHLIKVSSTWISIVYVICFAGVAMWPGMRPGFMMYGLHMGGYPAWNVLNFGTFFSGLILWNIVAILSIWLFVALWNGIKK